MKRYLVLTLVACLLLVLVGMTAAQEAITPGTPIEGEYAGEPVVYTVDASRGQLIIASMVSEDFDTYVAITAGDEELASDDDSGTNNNALLAFVAQGDGPYTLQASASYFDNATGPYTLTVDVIDPASAPLDAPVTLEPSGDATQLYAVFEATARTVVNLSALSSGEDDIAMTLIGVDAQEIDRDDDDGPGNNAVLRRVVLPDDGLYLVRVGQSYSEDPLASSVELTIETSEQLYLSEEPQPLVLGDGEGQIGTEVYTVDVEAGKTYRFIFTIEPQPDDVGGIKLELLDSDRFFDPEVDAQHATRVSWDFVPNSTGTVRVDVHPTLFAQDLQKSEYTAALEVIDAE